MKFLFWVMVTLTALTVAGWLAPTNSAMTKCQEKHSYDVCFQQLNR